MENRRLMLGAVAALGLMWLGPPAHAAPPPPTLEDILKPSQHDIVKISPNGKYVAATVRKPENNQNRMLLAVIDRETNKPVRVLDPEEKAEISRVWWVNDQRLYVMSTWGGDNVQQYYLDPRIVAINVDGSRIRSFYATIVDTLIDDDDTVLVTVTPFASGEIPFTTLERMNVFTGTRKPVARAPVRGASFLTDLGGQARFASGINAITNRCCITARTTSRNGS